MKIGVEAVILYFGHLMVSSLPQNTVEKRKQERWRSASSETSLPLLRAVAESATSVF